MNFYIADTHFGHSNIIRLCNRPFYDVNQMDETLIYNWNKRVSDEDVVYIVGDFAFKSAKNPVDILHRLRGKKVLIEGNHDDKNLRNPEFRKCFIEICQLKTIYEGNKKIQLCHYPLVEWDGYFRGSYLIYGHIHNNVSNRAYKVMKSESNALNAGVDVTNFMPVTFEELIALNEHFKSIN